MTSTGLEPTTAPASPAHWVDAQTPHAKIYVGPTPAFTEAQITDVKEACARIRRFEGELLRESRAASLIIIDPLVGTPS
jgi:hypothetical protein